jgi:hypothetical protein
LPRSGCKYMTTGEPAAARMTPVGAADPTGRGMVKSLDRAAQIAGLHRGAVDVTGTRPRRSSSRLKDAAPGRAVAGAGGGVVRHGTRVRAPAVPGNQSPKRAGS